MTAEIHDGPQPAGRYCLCMAAATNDTSTGLRGRFWLQGNPEDEAIVGRLFLMPSANPLLELDEPLTPLMQETSRTKLPDGTEVVMSSPVSSVDLARQSLCIHGTLETGELVTLPSAFTAGWTVRGSGYNIHRLQAFYAISVTTWTALPPCSPASSGSGYATSTPGLVCRASRALLTWLRGRRGWPSSRQRFPRRRWPAALGWPLSR